MRVLLFDNYDSFTYNLVHCLRQVAPGAEIEVHRNDKISLSEIERFDKIVLSPGPGLPSEAGILHEVLCRDRQHRQQAERKGCNMTDRNHDST